MTADPLPLRWSHVGLVVLVALLAGAGIAAPLLGGAEGALLGGRTVDSLGSWWFQWWVDRALSTGASLERTDLLFYPWGKEILRDSGANVVDALLVLPVRRAFGGVAAWNVLYVGILVTNGLAGGLWMLLRRVPLAGAMAAAAVCAVHPYVLFELAEGRPTQALLAPLIGALAVAGASFAEEGGRRGLLLAVASGLLLGLAGWVYWFGAGFAALAICVLAVGRPVGARALRLGVIGGVSFAATAPAVLPLSRALVEGSVSGLLPVHDWVRGQFRLVLPNGDVLTMATLGWNWMAGYLQEGDWMPSSPAFGYVALAAVLPCLVFARRWALALGAMLALAVGPVPAGYPNPFYLGLAVLAPPMERLYWPVRALAVFVPAAALGIGFAVARLRGRWALAVAIAFPVAMTAESWARGVLPLATWEAERPRALECLADAGGAVIELPYGEGHDGLVHQTVHGLPMFGGMNERSIGLVPAEQRLARRENSWLRALLIAPANPRDGAPWTEDDRAAVRAMGYRWVALAQDAVRDPNMVAGSYLRLRGARKRLEAVAGAPVLVDDDFIVYAPWGDSLPCAGAKGEPTDVR